MVHGKETRKWHRNNIIKTSMKRSRADGRSKIASFTPVPRTVSVTILLVDC